MGLGETTRRLVGGGVFVGIYIALLYRNKLNIVINILVYKFYIQSYIQFSMSTSRLRW